MLAFAVNVWAADVSPSRETVPQKFREPPGGRFSIFSGDPDRIKKANRVDLDKFETEIKVENPKVSLSEPGAMVKVTFSIKNIGKKAYTLSFPNAQRFDIAVADAEGNVLYLWSEDKIFIEEVGASMLNPLDRITFVETIPLAHFRPKAKTGSYTVAAVLSNYPELIAKTNVEIEP